MRNRIFPVLLWYLSGGALGQPTEIFGDGFESPRVVAYTLNLSPNAVLFTAPGETRDLSLEVVDPEGMPAARAVTWRSTKPEVVSVSPQGEITALAASGSAQIIVETAGALPAMALVVIAAPAAGAMLVGDDQVLSDPALVDPDAPYGLGSRYTIELALGSAPAIGQVLLASGEARVGGRVVAVSAVTGGFLVTLEVIPISEMFDQFELDETLDLSTAPATIEPALTDVYDVVRRLDGSVELKIKPAPSKIAGSGAFDLDPDHCEETGFNLSSLFSVSFGPEIGVEHDLDLHLGYGLVNGLEELRVAGFVQGIFEVKPRIASAFEGKVKCRLNVLNAVIPFGGPVSWLFSGIVPVGIGFEIGGKVTLTEQIGFDQTITAHASFNTGLLCGAGDCEMVAESDAGVDGNLRPVLPPTLGALSDTARFEANAQGFAYAQLGIGNPILGSALASANFSPIEVLVGLKQSLDLESMASQAGKNGYASSFKLELVGSVGASNDIYKLLSLLQINAPPLTLEHKKTLAQSPKGHLSITPVSVVAGSEQEPGELATFQVVFTSIDYLGIDVVSDVQIMFAKDDGSGGVTLSPAPGSCALIPAPTGPAPVDKGIEFVFACQTDFLQQHLGQHRFVAFYTGTLFGLDLPIPLEITANSARPLSVIESNDLFLFTFDEGLEGWQQGTSGKDLDEVEWLSFFGNPGGTVELNGSDFAIQEDPEEPNAWIYKSLALPADAAVLSFQTRATNDAALRVRLVAGGVSHTLLNWEVLAGGQWRTRSADVSAYAGQTVTIYFEQDDDGEGVGEFRYVDNVRITRALPDPQ